MPKKTAPPPASGRDATKQETRDALIRAAVELFAEQGLDVPSLDAICARAGFTRGAFYVHFKDREDLIVSVMDSVTSSFLDAILAAKGASLELSQICVAFAAAVAGGSFPVFGEVPLHQFLAACSRSEALRTRYIGILDRTRARLAEIVRADQRAGRIRDDVDPVLLAGILISLALGVGTLLEIKMPFDTGAHAEAALGLVVKR